jgi:hypothetical protein
MARFNLLLLMFLKTPCSYGFNKPFYLVALFYFAKKFLAFDGVMSLFHMNDLRHSKEVSSYVEIYVF